MSRLFMLFPAVLACASMPEGQHVAGAEVEGANALDPDDILEGLQNHPPDGIIFVDYAKYEPLALDLDKKRILSFYMTHGYYSAEVTAVDVDEVEDGGVSVRFSVVEGRPSLVKGARLEGAPDHLQSVLELELDQPLGEPFEYERYVEVKARLRRRLVGAGYAFARVAGRADVDRRKFEVETVYQIDAGPKVVVRSIKVEGLEDMPREFVDNRMVLEVGDIFDPTALDESRARMLSTGLVESVRFRWNQRKRQEAIDLVVVVTRGDRNEVRLGLGVGRSQNLQLRGRAGYVRKSLLDPRLTFGFEVRPSYEFIPDGDDGPSIEATVDVKREDFIFSRLAATAEVTYGFSQREAYHTHGPSTAVGVSRPFLSDRLRIGTRLEYQYYDVGVDDLLKPLLEADMLEEVGIADPLQVTFATPFVTFDGRDNPLDPSSGVVADLRLEVGSALGGGFGMYVGLRPELKGYIQILPQLVGGARVRFSTLLSGGPLPITRRYFAGGPESQRGFGRRRLSPRLDEATELPIGGEAMVETNVELRLNIVRVFDQWLGIVVFLDGADSVRTLDQLDLARLHWASGGGLRYRTPVGPIRIDLGIRINRRPEYRPDDNWALHFSLGEAF